jgi:soluble lytic murein transglycosylase-like protein
MINDIMNRIINRIPAVDAFRNQTHALEEAAQTGGAAQAGTSENASFNQLVRQFTDATQQNGININNETALTVEEQINRAVLLAAGQYDLDPELIRAVIRAESNFRPDVVSGAGAMGLMQLMPGTAASLGVTDPFDIAQNIDGGSQYLRRMLDLFDQDVSLALAAYNSGAGSVRRHGGIPPFTETQNFVPRVQSYWEQNLLQSYRDSTRFG